MNDSTCLNVSFRSAPTILTLTAVRHHMTGLITTDKILDVTVTIKLVPVTSIGLLSLYLHSTMSKQPGKMWTDGIAVVCKMNI